jgi:hypothetical protein
VRRGVLKFRGYKPKQTPVNPTGPPTDADFAPDFEQKGVDMRIGLDIASYSANRWWAVQDSNLRPPACKAGALTS